MRQIIHQNKQQSIVFPNEAALNAASIRQFVQHIVANALNAPPVHAYPPDAYNWLLNQQIHSPPFVQFLVNYSALTPIPESAWLNHQFSLNPMLGKVMQVHSDCP